MRPYYNPIMFNQTFDGVDLKRHIIGTYYLEDPLQSGWLLPDSLS